MANEEDRRTSLKKKFPDWDWDYWEAMLEAFGIE